MHQNRFFFSIQQYFQGFTWLILISVCLTTVILFAITRLSEDNKIRICRSEYFESTLNLIAPTQLGVDSWQIGDYARYRHQGQRSRYGGPFDREVGFHIIAELEKLGSQGYWMKKTGFDPDRGVPKDIYRYVTVRDLRVTPRLPRYEFVRNYFPSLNNDCEQGSIPHAKLVKLGEDTIETEAGIIECIHYRAELGPDHNHNVIEIWTSATIPPLGIVRAKSPIETLELTAFGQNPETTVPVVFQPVIEGISTLGYGCSSCHGEGCHEIFFPPR